ncbi:hypothetical protein KIW84_034278 [Lathyrus oleraceus]|uniref:Uncharacterized protein n=1 Tax=Pisum sativum TaxID=3888 RepID=A0A9D4XY65_PEA|nr:hypothetical protein KIW84_034278 [Pisum sativum]
MWLQGFFIVSALLDTTLLQFIQNYPSPSAIYKKNCRDGLIYPCYGFMDNLSQYLNMQLDAFDHAQQAARVFKNRSSLRSTLLEAPSVPQPNYEWMSVIDSRACWNIGNGQRVKMLGDNWFLGQDEFEVWSHASILVIRLIEDEANNGNCDLFFIYFNAD